MSDKKLIFAYREDKLGTGEVVYCWQPGNRIIAFCGENKVITLVDKMGKKIIDFPWKLVIRINFCLLMGLIQRNYIIQHVKEVII